MNVHPGALVGLPPGVPNPLYDLGLWRDLLLVLAALAGAAEWKARHRSTFVAAIAFGVLAVSFWVFALGRPYGVLLDPAATRWAADVAVSGSGSQDGFVAGEAGAAGPAAALVRRGAPAGLVVLAPTLLPLVFLPVSALLVAALAGGDRRWAALLWVAAATGPLDVVRGFGIVPGLWKRPAAALVFLAVLGAAALVQRLPGRAGGAVAGALVLAASLLVPSTGTVGVGHQLLLLTLDQWPWILPAAAAVGLPALRRGLPPVVLGLLAGGAAGVLSGVVQGSGAVWLAHAAYRAGVLILAARGLRALVDAASGASPRPDRLRARLGGLLVFGALAGSFLAWWDPSRLDPMARESLEPVAPGLLEVMAWVRDETPASSAFVAAPEYAPAVAVLGGRRVLRAPGLVEPPDDERRRRTERAILAGRRVPDLVRRYGLGYVLAAPGQFREHGIEDPADLARRGLRLVYSSPRGLRIYEVGGSEPVK
jgi:hypothetical protein